MNSLSTRDLKGSFSSYGHHDYYYEPSYSSCCPLTVDSKTFVALIGFIGLATYLLLTVIDMSMLGGRRKRSLSKVILTGTKIHTEYQFFAKNHFHDFMNFRAKNHTLIFCCCYHFFYQNYFFAQK